MPNLGRGSLKEIIAELKINSELILDFEFLPKDMELIESYKGNTKLLSRYAPYTNILKIQKNNLINEIKMMLEAFFIIIINLKRLLIQE